MDAADVVNLCCKRNGEWGTWGNQYLYLLSAAPAKSRYSKPPGKAALPMMKQIPESIKYLEHLCSCTLVPGTSDLPSTSRLAHDAIPDPENRSSVGPWHFLNYFSCRPQPNNESAAGAHCPQGLHSKPDRHQEHTRGLSLLSFPGIDRAQPRTHQCAHKGHFHARLKSSVLDNVRISCIFRSTKTRPLVRCHVMHMSCCFDLGVRLCFANRHMPASLEGAIDTLYISPVMYVRCIHVNNQSILTASFLGRGQELDHLAQLRLQSTQTSRKNNHMQQKTCNCVNPLTM
ncbi:hypothetical protein PABG_00712 [Paracoccidioides brasiliensis Pb03]|nr:hypothetical protein PABG_00712 [Paracoccidioides brasiliensis Pb03]